MPREFMMLLTHSMFVRGHIAEAGHIINPNARHVNNDSNNANQIRAESTLVFNGVTKTNNKIDALIEDVNSGRVMTVHPGDSIARGTVGKITMDSLEYISDGKTTQIGIGQNFTGSQGDVSLPCQ